MKLKYKWLIIIMLLSVTSNAKDCQAILSGKSPLSTEPISKHMDCIAESMSKSMKGKLPKRIDKFTRLDSITNHSNRLIYQYTLLNGFEKLVKNNFKPFAQNITGTLKLQTCMGNMGTLIQNGLIVQYLYKTEDNIIRANTIIDNQKCQSVYSAISKE